MRHTNGKPRSRTAKLESYIDFEMLRSLLEKAANRVPAQGPGGRPRLDIVRMFKVVILQRIYNLSDERTEYHIRDCLSFRRFLGLGIGDTVPDSRTIWRFREDLTHDGTVNRLFDLFNQKLLDQGIITQEGAMVDAGFVTVPTQRKTRKESNLLRAGKTSTTGKRRRGCWLRKTPMHAGRLKVKRPTLAT
jgi:transposase, IS5 family